VYLERGLVGLVCLEPADLLALGHDEGSGRGAGAVGGCRGLGGLCFGGGRGLGGGRGGGGTSCLEVCGKGGGRGERRGGVRGAESGEGQVWWMQWRSEGRRKGLELEGQAIAGADSPGGMQGNLVLSHVVFCPYGKASWTCIAPCVTVVLCTYRALAPRTLARELLVLGLELQQRVHVGLGTQIHQQRGHSDRWGKEGGGARRASAVVPSYAIQ
jgi:hypothetical protein